MSGLSLQNFHKKLHVTVKKYNLSNVTTQPEKPDFISLLIRKKLLFIKNNCHSLCKICIETNGISGTRGKLKQKTPLS